MFQIVQGSPVHCQITDGIVGSRYRILPMTYHRKDYAQRLAGAMQDRNYNECGDDWFYVIEAGASALNNRGRENRVPNTYTFRDADGNMFDTGVDSQEVPF